MSKKINTKYRTLRLSSFSVPLWHEIIRYNINQTEKLIDYCIDEGYKILRLSSDIIPFATHSITDGSNWSNEYAEQFDRIGQKANENNLHLSMHPA